MSTVCRSKARYVRDSRSELPMRAADSPISNALNALRVAVTFSASHLIGKRGMAGSSPLPGARNMGLAESDIAMRAPMRRSFTMLTNAPVDAAAISQHTADTLDESDHRRLNMTVELS